MMDFQKLNGTRIPLTQQHIDTTQAVFRESNNPVSKAMQATLGEDFTVLIYLLHEQIVIFQKSGDKIHRKVGTLQTAGTLDEWLFNHAGGSPVPAGHLLIYMQAEEENDERLWIGFQKEAELHKELGI